VRIRTGRSGPTLKPPVHSPGRAVDASVTLDWASVLSPDRSALVLVPVLSGVEWAFGASRLEAVRAYSPYNQAIRRT